MRASRKMILHGYKNFLKIWSMPVIFFFLGLIATACNTQPLFDQLHEDRILVFMRGTYESNDPKDFTAFPASASNANAIDNSVVTTDPLLALTDLSSLRFDIAQISTVLTDVDTFAVSEVDVKLLSNKRQIFFFKFADNPTFTKEELFNKYDLEDPTLSAGDIQELINLRTRQNAEFFNDAGYGVYYEGDDVARGLYNRVRVYFRRMVTGEAKAFLKDATTGNLLGTPLSSTANFNNDLVYGQDIAQFFSYDENEIYSPTRNFLFPHSISKYYIIPENDPFHIELRFFAKNRMKIFETLDYNDLVHARFWGFADFN